MSRVPSIRSGWSACLLALWMLMPLARGDSPYTVLRTLSPAESAKMDSDVERSVLFVKKYVAPSERTREPLKDLDLAFARWSVAKDPAKESKDQVTDLLGAALGDACVKRLKMQWVILAVEFGDGKAVLDEKNHVWLYPFTEARDVIGGTAYEKSYSGYEEFEKTKESLEHGRAGS